MESAIEEIRAAVGGALAESLRTLTLPPEQAQVAAGLALAEHLIRTVLWGVDRATAQRAALELAASLTGTPRI